MVANPPSENIYIKGLPTDSNENDLVNVFAQFWTHPIVHTYSNN